MEERRKHPRHPVVMTGRNDLSLAFDSITAGAPNCLFKPLSVEILSRAVAHGLTTIRTGVPGTTGHLARSSVRP